MLIETCEDGVIDIDEGAWRVIAHAKVQRDELTVIESATGKRIVYGAGSNRNSLRTNAGFIVEPGPQVRQETIRAIRRVAGINRPPASFVRSVIAQLEPVKVQP